jgi:branched-chain amino acid transport system permease protein
VGFLGSMDDFTISVVSNIGLFSFLALSAYLLLLTGEISFGQQAYFALGAYGAGIATAMWGWPLAMAIVWAVMIGMAAGALVALPTVRLRGLYFSIATLAFAEMVRHGFLIFTYRRDIDGYEVGPLGAEGFRDIRYIYESGITSFEYMVLIYALLAAVLALFVLMETARLGAVFRMIGDDPVLAEMQGINVTACKVLAAAIAGGIAGLGGCLYAHLVTYVEPAIFNVMLGVHALAYGLIGGLGTALGPILGVVIDIGVLESTRIFSGYRMIVFGGLVALILIVRPRGILDESVVHKVASWRRRVG